MPARQSEETLLCTLATAMDMNSRNGRSVMDWTRRSGMDCSGGDHLWCVLVLMLYLPKKIAVQVHNKWQKAENAVYSHLKNSILQFRIFRLLCVMDLISSISPISPSNKVWHAPFGACSGIIRHKLFTKSHFCCIVYKLLSIFLVLGTLSFTFFFSGFHLGTSLSAELLSLDLVHSPMPKQNRSWCFLECFWIFVKSEGEIKSMTHYSRRAT